MNNLNNSSRPAAPCTHSSETEGGPYYKTIPHDGLTKREYFAGLAMQNIISRYNPWECGDFDSSEYEICAENAVGLADALLEELDK